MLGEVVPARNALGSGPGDAVFVCALRVGMKWSCLNDMSMHILMSVCVTPFPCTCVMAIPAQASHLLTPVRCRADLDKTDLQVFKSRRTGNATFSPNCSHVHCPVWEPLVFVSGLLSSSPAVWTPSQVGGCEAIPVLSPCRWMQPSSVTHLQRPLQSSLPRSALPDLYLCAWLTYQSCSRHTLGVDARDERSAGVAKCSCEVDAEHQWKILPCIRRLPWMNCSAWGPGARLPQAEALKAVPAVLMWAMSSSGNHPAWMESRV